jgi:antitoxin component of RelBE/YafQ-DinJ toxin-antitoxin module
MSKGKKRQVCFRIEETIVEEMEQIREKTGVPVSTQIELRLKGFAITSTQKKDSWNKVLQWYANSEKDEELANNVDLAVERMRRELKLH